MIAEWIKDGVMADLTGKISGAGIDLSQYLQPLVDLHRYNGKLYGLPKDWDTIAYFYNADYFTAHHIAVPTEVAWNPPTAVAGSPCSSSSPWTRPGTTRPHRGSTLPRSAPMQWTRPMEMQWASNRSCRERCQDNRQPYPSRSPSTLRPASRLSSSWLT